MLAFLCVGRTNTIDRKWIYEIEFEVHEPSVKAQCISNKLIIKKFDYFPRPSDIVVLYNYNRYSKLLKARKFYFIDLTWALVTDEIELKSLFEGILVDVILHCHPAND